MIKRLAVKLLARRLKNVILANEVTFLFLLINDLICLIDTDLD